MPNNPIVFSKSICYKIAFQGFVLCLVLASFSCTSKTESHPKKVVLVILDGIPASILEKTPTPHLDAIASQGGYSRAWLGGEKDGYSETPTISAVGYNSMLTGTWVNKHNVKDNSIQFPNYHYQQMHNKPNLKSCKLPEI